MTLYELMKQTGCKAYDTCDDVYDATVTVTIDDAIESLCDRFGLELCKLIEVKDPRLPRPICRWSGFIIENKDLFQKCQTDITGWDDKDRMVCFLIGVIQDMLSGYGTDEEYEMLLSGIIEPCRKRKEAGDGLR